MPAGEKTYKAIDYGHSGSVVLLAAIAIINWLERYCSSFSWPVGSQMHSEVGMSQPEQTSASISRPHVAQGEHPQVWHMVVSLP